MTLRDDLKELLERGITDPGLAAQAYALATLLLVEEVVPMLERVATPLPSVEVETIRQAAADRVTRIHKEAGLDD